MTATPIEQKPIEPHSVRTISPIGLRPFDTFPWRRPFSVRMRSNSSITSWPPTAEHDFPVHTKTCRLIGALSMGASFSSSARSVMNFIANNEQLTLNSEKTRGYVYSSLFIIHYSLFTFYAGDTV